MMRLAAFSIATVVFIGAAVGSASADMPVERGSYLVNTILTCGNCHSPKGPPQAVAGKDFSGWPSLR
jgi:cytochrome c553